ncbi:macrolide 2'-phosphotransferase [Cryobacterium adonitolivorans]|uniref:Macrolide 2'-phosphotransferase n=1 Tax=Cryobacterium adonitolivorans TaxID=1259189 RepID=A0A4R8W9F1_9MICO|nr:phosphotransferase [Cryobacterium adonitolivorans]TFC03500.1 macrolide 2'-phosphotransferase [Cryobacterium adonitolivorans]
MARSHLTLAALATNAVPELDVAHARNHSLAGGGLFDSALLVTRDEKELIIRVPTSQAAETEQSADLVALRALTTGNRSRLPFDVPVFVGQAPFEGTRAVVYERLPGASYDADALTGHEGVSGSIGRAIAAIHGLPSAFIGDAGLVQQSAQDCRTATIDLIDRAANTGRLPAALLRRWELATDDDALWQFAPTVIHGSLAAESFLISDDAVCAVLGWSGLSVGDPARDLNWLLAARGDAAETAVATYAAARQGNDPLITQRAMLYAELELARWLLHGVDSHDEVIVDDAVSMLDGLVDNVHSHTMNSLSPDTGPILSVSDVESMLKDTPRTRATGSAGRNSDDSSEYGTSEFADTGSFARVTSFDGTGFDTAGYDTGYGDDSTGPIPTEDAADGTSGDTATDDHAAKRSSSE